MHRCRRACAIAAATASATPASSTSTCAERSRYTRGIRSCQCATCARRSPRGEAAATTAAAFTPQKIFTPGSVTHQVGLPRLPRRGRHGRWARRCVLQRLLRVRARRARGASPRVRGDPLRQRAHPGGAAAARARVRAVRGNGRKPRGEPRGVGGCGGGAPRRGGDGDTEDMAGAGASRGSRQVPRRTEGEARGCRCG